MSTYKLLNGKKGVKALYIDQQIVATWDKTMDDRDLEAAIERRVGNNELTEIDTDHRSVTEFPTVLKAPEPEIHFDMASGPDQTATAEIRNGEVISVTLEQPTADHGAPKAREDMSPAEKRKDTLAKKVADKAA